jgi:hypothetical protein
VIAGLALLAMPVAGAAPLADPYPVSCFYSDRSGTLERAEACATADAENPRLSPQVVARLGYDHGLAQISIAKLGWFYRHRNGRTVHALIFDNGPDPFAQGLARARVAGGLVYVDRRLRVRIRTVHDWGEPFENGHAAVCTGCTTVAVDGGEHHVVTGGRWGLIDCRGELHIPVRYGAAELDAMRAEIPAKPCRR